MGPVLGVKLRIVGHVQCVWISPSTEVLGRRKNAVSKENASS